MRLVLATVLLSASAALADDCLLTWKAPQPSAVRNNQSRVYALTERQGATGAWTALATLPWGTTQHAVACEAPKPRCWQLTLRVLGDNGTLMGESDAVETCEAVAAPQDVPVADATPLTPEQVQTNVATMDRDHRETSGVNAALAEIAQAEATLGTPPPVLVPLNDHQATIDGILSVYQERISVIWESFTIEREHIQHAPKRERERLDRELRAWAEQAQQQAFIWATQQVDYVLMRRGE